MTPEAALAVSFATLFICVLVSVSVAALAAMVATRKTS